MSIAPKKIVISASILSADFFCLKDAIARAIDAGIDYIHFDVMDNHFVPNLSFGSLVCQALRPHTSVPIDVHLMVDNPGSFIRPFADAGANLISFHPETANVSQTIADIKTAGMSAGLAFNPERPLDVPPDVLSEISLLLIMSVHPGFGGQVFMKDSLVKIRQAREALDKAKSTAFLGIDGGIKGDIVESVVRAGADFIVMGSGLFQAPDYRKVIQEVRAQFK